MEYAPKGKKPDVTQALDGLKKLQNDYNEAANDNRRKADAMGLAVKALEEAKARDDAHEAARYRDRISVQAAYIKGLLAHEKKSHEFFVFIDHTGSITQKPFYAALDGAAVLKEGARAGVALWGSMDDVRPVTADILDPAVRAGFEKKGASSDFKPVVDDMIKTAALNQANGKPTHFIVIGDGEFADYPAAKAQMEKLLKGRYRATVDFIIFARPDTSAEFLSEQLAKDFPGRVKHHLVNGPAYWQGTEVDLSKAVQDTIAQAATARILHAPKAAAQPKAQPAAAPKPPQA
jgi:hypothetical protein